MTGLLWDRIAVQFDELPNEGHSFAYAHSSDPSRSCRSTDPVVEVLAITRHRFKFCTREVDYILQLVTEEKPTCLKGSCA